MVKLERRHTLGAFAVILAAWLLSTTAGVLAATDSPQALIRSVTGNVLDTLRAQRGNNAMSQAKLVELIEQQVVPYFDFKLMSAQVLGRYWRGAEETQREQFTAAFKQLLTNTYASVFGRYEGQTVTVLDTQKLPDSERVLVTTTVKSPGKPDIQVDYRLYQDNGKWKIYDVVADGISLLINYRSEYASELAHGNLEGLIGKLEAKNAAFQKKSH